jgi:voltage-gated potassium channel
MEQILRIAALLATLTFVGVMGFMTIEGWDFLEALYMSIITLSTVGYREVQPLSDAGRVFVIVYLVAGLGVFFYGVAQIGEAVLQAQLCDWFGRRRMEKIIRKMKDHYVVCGFGRMGRHVCAQLAAKGLPFVAIDKDEDVLLECKEKDWLFVQGDATEDRILSHAGIEQARGLAAVLPKDADNVYVTLSARILAPDVQIIARASDEKGVTKMRKAGASRVVSLYTAGAVKIAHFFIHPNVNEFLDVVTTEGTELDLAEVAVKPETPFAGQTIEEADFAAKGVVIVGLREATGRLLLPPRRDQQIQAGDSLIALGRADVIDALTSSVG